MDQNLFWGLFISLLTYYFIVVQSVIMKKITAVLLFVAIIGFGLMGNPQVSQADFSFGVGVGVGTGYGYGYGGYPPCGGCGYNPYNYNGGYSSYGYNGYPSYSYPIYNSYPTYPNYGYNGYNNYSNYPFMRGTNIGGYYGNSGCCNCNWLC